MGTLAVDVQDVSKRFRLYHEKYTSLKEKVIHAGRVPYEDLWALRDVSFDVQEGETVGILGRNGSGKSTLLKCVCGVLQPTSGQVVVRGKLAGLLELGAGFQQDLSGRENIYLNGSMLGLSKREMDRVFDDIVEFAELGQFIDNQVKFYSSGMYVRLGFAVAVNVDPDVLVIDEVLAVGDERFQRKCMDRIKQFQREGRTILLVTHSPDQVRAVCDRAVVLSDGVMIGEGAPGEAVRLFRERLMEAGDELALGGGDGRRRPPHLLPRPPLRRRFRRPSGSAMATPQPATLTSPGQYGSPRSRRSTPRSTSAGTYCRARRWSYELGTRRRPLLRTASFRSRSGWTTAPCCSAPIPRSWGSPAMCRPAPGPSIFTSSRSHCSTVPTTSTWGSPAREGPSTTGGSRRASSR